MGLLGACPIDVDGHFLGFLKGYSIKGVCHK